MRTKSDFALGAAALACLALMLVRTVSIFHQGPYVLTSGYEEESLFAIWKWINKQAVYGNAFAPPFAQSYFNWLFYFVYGAFQLRFAFNSQARFLSGARDHSLPDVCAGVSVRVGCVSTTKCPSLSTGALREAPLSPSIRW